MSNRSKLRSFRDSIHFKGLKINQMNGEKYQYGPASFKGYPVVDMCTFTLKQSRGEIFSESAFLFLCKNVLLLIY